MDHTRTTGTSDSRRHRFLCRREGQGRKSRQEQRPTALQVGADLRAEGNHSHNKNMHCCIKVSVRELISGHCFPPLTLSTLSLAVFALFFLSLSSLALSLHLSLYLCSPSSVLAVALQPFSSTTNRHPARPAPQRKQLLQSILRRTSRPLPGLVCTVTTPATRFLPLQPPFCPLLLVPSLLCRLLLPCRNLKESAFTHSTRLHTRSSRCLFTNNNNNKKALLCTPSSTTRAYFLHFASLLLSLPINIFSVSELFLPCQRS